MTTAPHKERGNRSPLWSVPEKWGSTLPSEARPRLMPLREQRPQSDWREVERDCPSTAARRKEWPTKLQMERSSKHSTGCCRTRHRKQLKSRHESQSHLRLGSSSRTLVTTRNQSEAPNCSYQPE